MHVLNKLACSVHLLCLLVGLQSLHLLLLLTFIVSPLFVGSLSLFLLDVDSDLFVNISFEIASNLRLKLVKLKFKSGISIDILLDAVLNNWHNFLLLFHGQAFDALLEVVCFLQS